MNENKIYVGNLPWSITSDSLRDLFSKFGQITDTQLITDRDTGRSKGFGFVTFANAEDAKKAIDELNEKEVDGRKLVVNLAKPRE